MSRYPALGDLFSAVHENLADLDRRMERLVECRLAQLDEWADAAAASGAEERDALLQLLDALHPDRDIPLSPDIPAENREALRDHYRNSSVPERLAVLRAVLARRNSDPLAEHIPEIGEISERAADKIAYVQNAFSDNAYLQFSAVLTHPRAAYFDSFSDVCEEVYNGICEYGILPILHERDGKLFRFYTLLEKYDLRLVCACDVPCVERDGVTVTRYALIRKTLSPLRNSGATHLELLHPADDAGGGELCDLLQAARACGLTPIRLDTRPAGDGDGPDELTHQITLALNQGDTWVFLAFLALCLPGCTVLGLYRVLET